VAAHCNVASKRDDYGQPDGPRLGRVQYRERVDTDVGEGCRDLRPGKLDDEPQRVVDEPERQQQVVGHGQCHQLKRSDRSLGILA